ncbi:hypothetical protein DA803_00355 [[Mycoplasma] phocae]|uniref:Uncharacterized protein n=1 Tax=[Mycoplasma] phocae TaxID=142651 RepID=A0A2Z5IPF2_9BACT|nr:hypothetical protein [[Mycoplasma] phocae]AXE60553.1 hypothetical protein DA803_00355 [[Mycoplasma] phocae]
MKKILQWIDKISDVSLNEKNNSLNSAYLFLQNKIKSNVNDYNYDLETSFWHCLKNINQNLVISNFQFNSDKINYKLFKMNLIFYFGKGIKKIEILGKK